jgi:glycosyltransferase involved in cell wall biosynthesis
MHFTHPEVLHIHDEAFLVPPQAQLRKRIADLANRIEAGVDDFVRHYSIDLLFPQNALTIPMNIPLGVGLTEFIARTGIPTIAHHHDLWWERKRFAGSPLQDILERYFPPDLPSIRHLVINSLAQQALLDKKNIRAWLLPNIFDFDETPPAPDAYTQDLRRSVGLDPHDRLILQPTRVIPRKGIELALELLRQLKDRHSKKLLLTHAAGDEGMDYLENLQAQAEESGVTLLYAADRFAPSRGMTPDGRKTYSLWDAYKVADFVTYPSWIEGFGNALLETIYFQLPALVNRYPVYRADIAPLGFDFVEIDGSISSQAVERVSHILDNAQERRQMVEHNFVLGRRHFSYAAAQSILVEVIGTLD